MTLHVALNHRTLYEYDRAVQMGPQIVRLRPAPHSRTPVLSYALRVEPDGHFLNWQQDPHGNFLARVVFPDKVTRFLVEVDLVADMAVRNPFDFFLEPDAEKVPFIYEPGLRKDLEPFLAVEPAGPLVRKWADALRAQPPTPTIDFLVDVNQRLQREIGYTIRLEPGVHTPEETLALKSGSCRDSAWLLVNILRHIGLASRFVSGYLVQLVADVKSLDGPSGAERDFTRPARMDGGVFAGRGLDRPRSDVGLAGRRRSHSARLHAAPDERGTDQRRSRGSRDQVRASHEGATRRRVAARHEAVQR